MPEVTWVPSFLDILLWFVPENTTSLLDVGCGRGVVGALVKIYREPQRIVGVDIFEPYLNFCRRLGVYSEVIKYDLRSYPYPFREGEFDVAVALEVIEHLPRYAGNILLSELERIARRVIISTPTTFFKQPSYDGNPFQQHLSRWSPRELGGRGYRVYGVGNLLVGGEESSTYFICIKSPHITFSILLKQYISSKGRTGSKMKISKMSRALSSSAAVCVATAGVSHVLANEPTRAHMWT